MQEVAEVQVLQLAEQAESEGDLPVHVPLLLNWPAGHVTKTDTISYIFLHAMQ